MDNLFVETRPIEPAYWRILTTWSDDAVTRSGLMDLWWAKQTFALYADAGFWTHGEIRPVHARLIPAEEIEH